MTDMISSLMYGSTRTPLPLGALDQLRLSALMARSTGHSSVRIGLIDGPVAAHPDLVSPLFILSDSACALPAGPACTHGTFVGGILGGRRGSAAPALCPACPLVVRPVFLDGDEADPVASPAELAQAILDVLRAGVRIINLSLAITPGPLAGEAALAAALDAAARADVLVVAAAGNFGRLASTALTRHPAVLTVVSCDASSRPSAFADLSTAAGRRGLMAPGEGIVSLHAGGGLRRASGTSFAAPFVTGIAALLASKFPQAGAAQLRFALAGSARRRSVVPPLADADQAFQILAQMFP